MRVRRLVQYGSALAIVAAVVLGVGYVTFHHATATSSRPRKGVLTVHMLRGATRTGAENYWLYINGEIVSSPPHKAYREDPAGGAGFTYVFLKEYGYELWNRNGDVSLKVNRAGIVVGLHEDADVLRYFEPYVIALPKGKYNVAVIYFDGQGHGGTGVCDAPFQVSEANVDVDPNVLGVLRIDNLINNVYLAPHRLCNQDGAPAARAAPMDENGQVNAYGISWFKNIASRFIADPVVQTMSRVYEQVKTNPPQGDWVYADFPSSLGGARNFDADEIRMIARFLRNKYGFGDAESQEILDAMRSHREYYEDTLPSLEGMIRKVTSQLDDYVSIADIMEGSHP